MITGKAQEYWQQSLAPLCQGTDMNRSGVIYILQTMMQTDKIN
jgi:hypothetical protein